MPDDTPDDTRGGSVAVDPFLGLPTALTADALAAPVAVEVASPVRSAVAPAVLGDPVLGTDRLLYVPRLRLAEPVVYVARDPKTGSVLYVGLTSDLDARRIRHEAEVERGDPSRSSGSNVVPGAWGLMRADWFAVPCPAEHARWLEQALKAVLRPVLDRGKRKGRLNTRHRAALEAAGWTGDVAERLVADHNRGG